MIDVGCAEGDYAIGLATRLPNAVVYAYDIDSEAKASCNRLAKANQVNARVQTHGYCDHRELEKQIGSGTLLICDCEGVEWQLLDPAIVPSLIHVDMLVELHPLPIDECKAIFEKRFGVSHEIEFIYAVSRSSHRPEMIQHWSTSEIELACNELRTDGHLWACAKAGLQ
jgi:hypothetical protein